MKKRISVEKKKKYIWISVIGLLFCCCLFLGVLFVSNSSDVTEEVETEVETTSILLAKKDIIQGQELTKDDFTIEIDTGSFKLPEDVVRDVSEIEGKRAKVDMKINEVLQQSKIVPKQAWYSEDDRLIEITFADGTIPSVYEEVQLVGKYVDVVLFRKGSYDETVISKQPIIAVNGNKLAFNLDQEQREYLKEASMEEAELYVTIYLDDEQVESKITYLPFESWGMNGLVNSQEGAIKNE